MQTYLKIICQYWFTPCLFRSQIFILLLAVFLAIDFHYDLTFCLFLQLFQVVAITTLLLVVAKSNRRL